ncbi:hypothetical protein PNP85_02675 [Halobacterium salinarum]|uniref:DUF6414 family protein n=1 Tax=Halobacterium salinarum TaxID=2242 RepID=UPI002555B546|nr:hypothetical protein [Halobacterium salinarum]MDL0135664.1 hypothetical protein [Halobacterium salinarum]MDL0138415.1 hypothetical protein [Halobacterium salinarum]
MVSFADAPEVVYTNDQIIDRLFSYLNEGDVKEVVERSLDSDTTDKGGGLSKILQLKYGKSSTDEEETELVRKFDSIGKFAVLHGMLQDEDDITPFDEIDEDGRRNLENGDFIEAEGRISASPINDLQEMIKEIKPYLDMFDFDMEFQEQGQEFALSDIQDFLNQLDSGENLYTVNTSAGSADANVVFSMGDGDLDSQLSEYTEYHVLGRVEHVYSRGEEEWLMNVMDLLPAGDRDGKKKRRMFLKQMVSSSSDLLDRNVTEGDFKVGYPDVRVRPVAIYLF